jgi:hypothetical protein
MPEKLACVVTRANLSGIAFIFELKYHPKYEKGKYSIKRIFATDWELT